MGLFRVGSLLSEGGALSGGRYYWDLIAARIFSCYFRGVATFRGSFLSQVCGRCLGDNA